MPFIGNVVANDSYIMKCQRCDFYYTIACFLVIISVIMFREYENCFEVLTRL